MMAKYPTEGGGRALDIYLLRHGIAEEQGAGAPSDAARRLTAEGRDKCGEAARGIAALKVRFDQVWTSPLVRARGTAELCLPDCRAETRDVLAGGTPEQLCAALKDLPARSA
ncbi:MAG: histidine phosphatase family protein, partial [Armatimonadetes bacterium]|nr:histidine phosphatase family protein [Armatimonadota bacterium]